MIILAIDTSQAASVALYDTDTDEVLANEEATDRRKHVEYIGPALARVLAHPTAPDLVVTGIGPGPFTGLRVGIAAGIGVGQARGIPVSGILSQTAIAEEFVQTVSAEAGSDNAGAEEAGVARFVPSVSVGADGAARRGVAAGAATSGGAAAGSVAPRGTSAENLSTVNDTGPLLIAGDARRKEVYFSVYSAAELMAGPFVAKPADVHAVLEKNGVFASNGVFVANGESAEHGVVRTGGDASQHAVSGALGSEEEPGDHRGLGAMAATGGLGGFERLGRGFDLYPDVLGGLTRPMLLDPRAQYLARAAARQLAVGRSLSDPVPEYLREPDARSTPVRQSTLR